MGQSTRQNSQEVVVSAEQEEFLKRAQDALLQGDKDEALKFATRAVLVDQTNFVGYKFRGQLNAHMRKFDAAVLDFTMAYQHAPRRLELLRLRARTHFKAGRLKDAIADWELFTKRQPDVSQDPYLFTLGIAYAISGRDEDARKRFEWYYVVRSNDVEAAAWHYLAVARHSGEAAAQGRLLEIKEDKRIPMMQIYEMLKGSLSPSRVLAAARSGEPSPKELARSMFYANLYIGVYFEEEQAETHDWLKRSDSVANKGFRIVNPKPTPAFTKKQEAKELLDDFGNDDPPDSASSSDAPLSPKAKTTWNQIGNLESALAFYYFDMQTFPSTTDGLAALLKPPADKNKARKWDGPYLEDKTIPADAWGNTFVYEYSPRRRQDFPHISSLGSDGSAKTKDDILNWGTAATKRRTPEIEMMMETDIGIVSSSSSSPQPEVTPTAQPTTKPKKEALAWKSDPGNPQNALVENKIRNDLNKTTGELTGADLEKVVNLTFVFKLNDKGIKEVAKLKRLRSLLLVKTGITDAGLRDLATLPELLSVTISGSDITDAGLKELGKLRQLEELGLPATPLTDQGLKELAKLKNLYSINLKGTKVTKAGVAALQKVLPSCNILHRAKK